MSKKGWIVFVIVVVVLFGGIIGLSYASKPKIDLSKVDTNAIQKASTANGNIADHVTGNAKSPVVLIEYGDFQCPYCGEAEPALKTVYTAYEGQIAFVFRNFPLTTMHPNAMAAAAAAEAAGLQGQYWKMHDELYANQSSWENLGTTDRTAFFVEMAKDAGINTKTFETDLSSTRVSQKISFDQAIGNKIGVNATPTMYLDGTKLSDSVTGDLQSGSGAKISAAINSELKAHGIALPSAANAKS